jgi:hypothetical protein
MSVVRVVIVPYPCAETTEWRIKSCMRVRVIKVRVMKMRVMEVMRSEKKVSVGVMGAGGVTRVVRVMKECYACKRV